MRKRYLPWAGPGVYASPRGIFHEDVLVPPRGNVWIVLYSHYIHGIFATSKDAEAYTERRWGAEPPSTWRIEPWTVGHGAFDPGEDERDE